MRDYEKTQDAEIWLRLPQRLYYYIGTPQSGGARVSRSLKTKSFKAAQIEKRRLLVDLRGLDPKAGSALFEEVAQDVLRTQKAKNSKATYVSAELHIRYLLKHFAGQKVSKIDESSWDRYRAECEKKNPDRLLKHDRAHFVMIMKRAFEKGFLRRPIKIEKDIPRESIGRALEDDEIQRLLKEASPVLYTQLVMALTMGMRRSEILKLTWDRVDMKKKIIRLRAVDTKTRKAREFPISPQAFDRLNAIEERTERGPVFPSRLDIASTMKDNKTAWQACKRRAGVDCRFHDLRHTFLTKAFRANKSNPMVICVYAGLSMEVAQKIYLHLKNEDKLGVAGLVSI